MITTTATPKHRESRRGTVSLEAAWALPIMLLLLFSCIEFGRYLWFMNVVTEAAAEGARVAILHEPTDSDVANTVSRILQDQGVHTDHSITIGARQPALPVSVRVEADVELVVLDNLLGDVMNMRRVASTSVMNHVP